MVHAVKSFKTKHEAMGFADVLRERGFRGVIVKKVSRMHWRFKTPVVRWVVFADSKEVID